MEVMSAVVVALERSFWRNAILLAVVVAEPRFATKRPVVVAEEVLFTVSAVELAYGSVLAVVEVATT
jgi:hypothetical protein